MSLLYETDENGTAVLTGAGEETAHASSLAVPAVLGSCPVERIAPFAFRGNQALAELVLPDGLKEIGAFAFHNCRALRSLVLTDSVKACGEGAFGECTALRHITVTLSENDYTAVRRLLADSDRTLTFDLRMASERAVLTFPGFVYDFTENTMARTIQFNIEGEGMAFRECVGRAGIDFRSYDRLFSQTKINDISIITAMLVNRLQHPLALSAQAREAYESRLAAQGEEVLCHLVQTGDRESLRFLLQAYARGAEGSPLFSHEALRRAAAEAASRRANELAALLADSAGRLQGGPEKILL